MSTKITLSTHHSELTDWFHRLADHGVPSDATLIYEARNRVFTIPLQQCADKPTKIDTSEQLNIKAYRTPNLINRIIYGHLRHSKARRAYDNALVLKRLSINTAAPVGYIEHFRHGLLAESYFISGQLPPQWTTIRQAHLRPDFNRLSRHLAAFILDLHNKGVWMKDFSPGNVMMADNPATGQMEFALIDINRMRFNVRNRRLLMRNFETIFETPEATFTLAADYAEAAGFATDSPEHTHIIQLACEAFQNKARFKQRKSRIKHLLGLH